MSIPSNSEFSLHLKNKVDQYNESLFRASAATLTEKEKRKGGNEHVGGGGGERNEVPYIALHRYQYPSQFLTTVSYVEQ